MVVRACEGLACNSKAAPTGKERAMAMRFIVIERKKVDIKL
jgi:hypothetical protein